MDASTGLAALVLGRSAVSPVCFRLVYVNICTVKVRDRQGNRRSSPAS